MLPQKCLSTPEFQTGITHSTYQLKRDRNLFKGHTRNFIILYITASLMLCAGADYRFRPHRPRPGSHIFKPLPVNEFPDGSSDDIHIVNETTIKPETSDAVSTESLMAETSDHTDTTRDANEENPADPVDNVNCPGCDEDENNKQNYPNDSGYSEEQKTDEEELNEMIEGLGNLLSNESAVVTIEDVSSAFDQMDSLLATEDESLEFPCAVLTALDALGARANLNGSAAVATARRNVAVVMADSAPGRAVRGLRIATGASDGFTDEALEILLDDVDPTTLSTDDTDALVNLPASLAESSRRISFVVFRSDRAFHRHDREQYVVNSKIISVHVENFTQMAEGEVVDIHLKPSTYEPARNMSRACAYWHFTENNTGYWSQEGCTFIKSPTGLLDTCRCTHLTHFAEILIPKLVFSEENETALEIISLIGCFLSLFGLMIVGLTAIMFRSWRNDFNNKIWIQLTIAIILNVVSFLIIVFSKFDDYNVFCMLVGITLHYAVLATFCWMLVAAVISYRKLVLVFAWNPGRRLLKVSVFSWLVPLVIVATLLAVAPQSYTKRFEGNTPTGGFCYPSGLGLWLSVFVPIGIVVILNWIIFALILRSVFGAAKIQKHGDSREMLRRASVCCLLVFLFGLPWILGLFAYNIVAAYLFTLTTSYQGFVLFVFFIIINTKTRGMWLDKFRIKKKTRAPVSSSLTTSKNGQISNEPEQNPFIEPSSSRTNVTSLVSNSSDGRVVYNATSGSAAIEDSHYNSKDSDIDSFITAKSHDNFSEDEIFKSLDGITDRLKDEEENNRERADHTPNVGTDMINNQIFKKMLATEKAVTDADATEDTPKIDHNDSKDGSLAKLKKYEFTSNEGTIGDHSSQIVGNDNDSIEPKMTIYNVPTQNASLIS